MHNGSFRKKSPDNKNFFRTLVFLHRQSGLKKFQNISNKINKINQKLQYTAMDKNTDITYTAQLGIFVRGIFPNFASFVVSITIKTLQREKYTDSKSMDLKKYFL